jgi:hypothetical protein
MGDPFTFDRISSRWSSLRDFETIVILLLLRLLLFPLLLLVRRPISFRVVVGCLLVGLQSVAPLLIPGSGSSFDRAVAMPLQHSVQVKTEGEKPRRRNVVCRKCITSC